MNAVTNSATNFIEENAGGSDSDTNPDESPGNYEPISVEADEEISDQNSDDDHDSNFHALPNGYCNFVENGVSSLDLSDNEEEEEEERMMEASDSAILRAFREDERRRNAPLTPDNATRVMEAMRGISFGGLVPDWADRVPEDRLIDQVRRLRPPPTASIQD